MGDDSQATLVMHKVDAALHAQAGRYNIFDKEREQMTVPSADLLANNKIKAILALTPEVARAQRPLDYVVIGQRDDRQVCIVLGMMQNLLDRCNTVAVGAMHMQIGPARLSLRVCLAQCHLSSFFQHDTSRLWRADDPHGRPYSIVLFMLYHA